MDIQKKSSIFPGIQLLACLAALLSGLASAARTGATSPREVTGTFERLGPAGGTVRSMLISSKNPQIVYVGTSDGQIFRSQNSGAAWRLLYPGIKRRRLVIDSIVEDPDDPNHIFAGGWDLRSSGGGLFESPDGGESWAQVNLPKASLAVRGFAISTRHSRHMIVGTGGGVFVTADGGKTWQQKGAAMASFLQAESVAIDPDDPRFLFVGTWHLGFRSSDFGATWVQNDKGMINDSDIFSIAIDPRNPKILYASACTGLYRSSDHAVSWTRLKVFPQSYLVRAHVVSVDPTDSTRIYGGTTEGLFASRDSGRTWSRVTPADVTVNAVQVDPANHDHILLGTELRGVLRSTDGGRSWAESNSGFMNRSIARIVPDSAQAGRFLVGEFLEGRPGGFHVYDSLKRTWLRLIPKETPGEGVLALLALPDARGKIAGTARGAYLQQSGSSEWSKLPGTISKLTVYDFALDKGGSWIFAGTSDGVYRARPGDLVFQRTDHNNILPRVFSLLASRVSPGSVFAGTHMGILHSDDSGATWRFASAGIPDYTSVESLVFEPGKEMHMLAGTTSGLFESRNGGKSWSPMAGGRLGTDIPSVAYLDSAGLRILAADNTAGGVFLSENGGASWSKLEHPELGASIRCLVQDPAQPNTIYLGTGTEGVYKLVLPGR